MTTSLKRGLLTAACVALLAVANNAAALVAIAPMPPPGLRVSQAKTIIVGKVESIEAKTVSAARFPGDKEKAEYQIAVIKVQDALVGAKGLTHVRVGFLPAPAKPDPNVKPGIGIRPIPRPQMNVTLAKDQEVLIYLTPHAEGNFHIAQNYYDVINKQGNANFEKEVAQVKTFVKLLADPKAGLKSDKQDERLMTASLLIAQYRAQRSPAAKTEAVDAETSKLILTALAEADWTNKNPQLAQMNPQSLFNQLGVTEKDGFVRPMKEVQGRKIVDFQKMPEAMKQWCKDNAGKYQIQRFVAVEKANEK